MATRKRRPWWLFGREEVCEVCGHRYAHGSGGRCAACDRRLCALCVVSERGEIVCTSCSEPNERSA